MKNKTHESTDTVAKSFNPDINLNSDSWNRSSLWNPVTH